MNNNMDKLEKVVKGKNIKHMLDAFFNKYIRKHFNEVNSIDFIISDLGEQMNDGGRNIKILRNDNPVRTNNPDWFPPKPQQTDHICTFLKQLIDNNLGTKDSYVGLKVEVVTETETYTWDVRAVDYYANSGTVILKTDPRQGVSIQCPAIVKLYIYPLLTSNAISSIIYNSIVTSESKYNFILGERNIHKGEDNVWIFGKNNISGETNHNSLINGYNNDVDSYGNIVIGDNNKHRSLLGATIGTYIKNFKQNSFLFGTGHDNSNGPSHEAIFGKYSKIEEDTVFAIGDGEDENNRHNLFELKAGGEILDKDGNDIRNGGGQQVQSDWDETDDSKLSFIKNKPSIPAEQVNTDWNATEGKASILNKPNLNNYVLKQEIVPVTGQRDSNLIPGCYYSRLVELTYKGITGDIVCQGIITNVYKSDNDYYVRITGWLYFLNAILSGKILLGLYGHIGLKLYGTRYKDLVINFEKIGDAYYNNDLNELLSTYCYDNDDFPTSDALGVMFSDDMYGLAIIKDYKKSYIAPSTYQEGSNAFRDSFKKLYYYGEDKVPIYINKFYKRLRLSTTSYDKGNGNEERNLRLKEKNKPGLYIKKGNILECDFVGLYEENGSSDIIQLFKFNGICDIMESYSSDVIIRRSELSFYFYFYGSYQRSTMKCLNITENIISQ